MSDQDDQLEFDDAEEWQGGPIGSMGPSLPSGSKPFDPDFSKVFGGGPAPSPSGIFSIYPEEYKKWKGTSGPAIQNMQGRNPNYLAGIPMFGGNPANSQNETKESCDHLPIDVGFARQKLVCKKCNKDL